MIVSPRQAQDKCRESTQKGEVRFSQVGHRTASPTPLRDLQVSAISAFFGRGGGGRIRFLLCYAKTTRPFCQDRLSTNGQESWDQKRRRSLLLLLFDATIMYYCRRCGSRGRLRPTPPSIKTTDQVTHSSPPSRCENASFLRRFVAAKKPEYLPRQAWDKHGKRFPREKACCVCLLLQAVCWLFGKEISLQLSPTGDVPVGLVSNNWGQKRKTPSSL